MSTFIYGKDRQRTISFPMGGIGSGCIGIAGNGGLIDWQIYNRPAMGTMNGYSHFAVKAQDESGLLDTRALICDLGKPYMGEVDKRTMLGLPHFKELEFEGKYPFARLRFRDGRFPGKVTACYYNPFIPGNDKDSSLPAVLALFTVENDTDREIRYTVAGSVTNPNHGEYTSNHFRQDGNRKGIFFATDEMEPGDTAYGDFTLATDGGEVSYQEDWFRGNWNDHVETYWREFASDRPLENRRYEAGKKGYKDTGLLCSAQVCAPGEKKVFRFVLAWNQPNCHNYWSGLDISTSNIPYDTCDRTPWKNYYATLFEDSWSSAGYALTEGERLYEETKRFADALYATTIPEEALDAVASNLAILSSPTCLRLEDGSFYGWEGCFDQVGSCEGTCTHVWNYAYALPHLFPALERSLRDLDYRYNQYEDGGMEFRLRLPLGSTGKRFHSCVDGQMGNVIKTYRDYKISGDRTWLAEKWEAVKKAVSYAWSEGNADAWDREKKGYIDGRQHHTLDMELFGPNAWLTGFYVGALQAAREMAKVLGDREAETEYAALAEKGRKYLNEELFNGEYYVQKVDIRDRSVAERFDAAADYWNDEKGQLKYQIGEGCGIDQALAQWHGNLCGLPDIFDKEKVRSALKAIYRYNYKPSLGDIYNPWRLFAIDEESGVIMCEWPEGTEKPAIPLTYAQECMDGMQYQVASHMIQEGMLEEGETIIRAIREKYRGDNRNPWCEIECGSYYARSLASYALIPSYSGFTCDMDKGEIGFKPVKRMPEGGFESFWSVGSGWGGVSYDEKGVNLRVLYGRLELLTFGYGLEHKAVSVRIDGEKAAFEAGCGQVRLCGKTEVKETLEIKWE